MTIRDLINILISYPPDMDIQMEDLDGEWDDICFKSDVEVIHFTDDNGKEVDYEIFVLKPDFEIEDQEIVMPVIPEAKPNLN